MTFETIKGGDNLSPSCDINNPMWLVPTPELSDATKQCLIGSKIWCVIHKPTGCLLHIRINTEGGDVLLTGADNLDWWVGHSEEQAKAQAAAMGEGFEAAYFVRTDQ